MRKLLAVLTAALLSTSNVVLAGDTSTGTTHPEADLEVNKSTDMQNNDSISNDGSVAAEGRTTGKGKQLNQGKTQTEPVDQGGRIEKR
jgi:hypothetical protein